MPRTLAPRTHRAWLALVALPAILPACAAAHGDTDSTAATAKAGADSGWVALFDGTSTAAWRGYRSDTLPGVWHIENGTLTKAGGGGDIITREPYGDFELELDWKLSKGGNAGIFYHATEEYDHVYWSGPEYQLLDDANHPDGRNRLTSAASDYALYPSPAGIVKPANEWNSARIVVRGAHVEHWLNGQKVVEYELWSPDWKARVAKSKFAAWRDYGMAHAGYIGIQGDHDGQLWIRNVRIRPLAPLP